MKKLICILVLSLIASHVLSGLYDKAHSKVAASATQYHKKLTEI